MQAAGLAPLDGLCGYVQHSLSADLVLAIEGGAQGKGRILAPERLRGMRGLDLACTRPDTPLPSALLNALGRQPAHKIWQPLPDLQGSGILILWGEPPAQRIDPAALQMLLAPFVALILADAAEREHSAHRLRFEDLFASVRTGIVLFDGDGREAYVNGPAARYLRCAAGEHPAVEIAPHMRALRESCTNVDELNLAYGAHLADPDYSMILQWRLPDLTLEVDTHPLRGDGRNGRLWLFNDVTAQSLMAAHMQRLAALDPLTELPNRRSFHERSAQILATSEAAGRGVGVMIVDIDHFKQVNDTYGHATGDMVLRTVATRCRDALPERGLFARYGGEEFVGLVSLAEHGDIGDHAETLRRAVAAYPVQAEGKEIHVTISIGTASTGTGGTAADEAAGTSSGAGDIATLGGGEAGPVLLSQLLMRADAALYRAKAEGRNLVRNDSLPRLGE